MIVLYLELSSVKKENQEADRAANTMARLGAAYSKERAHIPAALKAGLDTKSLAPRHFQAMYLIALNAPITVSALAQRLRIGRPAASQIATELEEANWLVREPDEKDQRRMWLSISSERRTDMEVYSRRRVKPLLRVLATMSPRIQESFLDGLDQLADEIKKLDEGAKA
jgi:DNA-binding MarR family transcriptional regulator